jgi:acetolactate synthase-1/2/3 large subunit
MIYTGAQIVIKLLENQGVKVIAGIPGSSNLPIYDELSRSSIKHILSRHEQGAGFIAQGIARTTGDVAVAFATSGPGATNIITAIADAKLDSIPVVFITGQVATSMIGTDAFQEVDTYGITIPITKQNFIARSAKELLFLIPEAFSIAASGRPGPVVIDIPKDVQLEQVEINELPKPGKAIAQGKTVDQTIFEKIVNIINESHKPVIYAGGGIIHANASEELLLFAEKNSIPVVTTLLALGSIPSRHSLNLGMLGMHGERYTNMAMSKADLIIAVGTRFDDRATGKLSEFCPKAKVIHIDIDQSEINKNRKADFSLIGNAFDILTGLEKKVGKNNRDMWLNEIAELKKQYVLAPESENPLNPYTIVRKVAKVLPEDAIISTDVGQHQMWVAQAYPFNKPRTFLTSGGLGTMGFGFPAAIGASIANPDKKVVCFSGDGSFLMNIQELATLADLKCNLTVLVMNNNHLGLVRQQQELFYNQNYVASKFETNLNFAAIAKAFGIESMNVDENITSEELDLLLHKAINNNAPCVVNIPIQYASKVFPMVPPGAGNTTMLWEEN